MKSTECKLGRVFVLRLEDGDKIPGCIEDFALEKNVECALVAFVGGVGSGKIVVGPEIGENASVTPMTQLLEGIHEAAAVGTIFPNENGSPLLHMHAALGRGGAARAGCVRTGIEVWTIGEVVIVELDSCSAKRVRDDKTGFELLAL